MLKFDPRSSRYVREADLICFEGIDDRKTMTFKISTEALEALAVDHFEKDPMKLFAKWRAIVFEKMRDAYMAGGTEPGGGVLIRAH